MAKEDQFGRDIKLTSGNVASRILPVKIHELDAEDKILLENELGGVLRSIEFIYKASGVNRPLKPNDERSENINHTYYRDQINKVANAVKEIITAIKKHNQQDGEISKEVFKSKPDRPKNLKPGIIIASFLLLALIILGYFLIPKVFKSSGPVEKSIAVLPFRNDSPNDSTTYFINGIMDEVLNNLQKIKDFRVLSRTSTEQYRGSAKLTIPKIAKELGVNYIVEGSGQKYGNKFVLRVQLIAADYERHLWAKSYDREIQETSDIISIQSEIAQSIASELKVIITPEVKQLIEKTPTANLTAYDFYQRGRDEYIKYLTSGETSNYYQTTGNKAILQKAEDFYHKALKYDSTFAQAYTGLARAYWEKHFEEKYFSENYMDSVLVLCDIALSFDNQLAEAYTIRGRYYDRLGKPEQALKEYDKALKINPNSWEAYVGKGYLYWDKDFIKSIENLQKAATLNHGSELSGLLGNISFEYGEAGFIEKSKYYDLEVFKLDGDSVRYLTSLGKTEAGEGNYKKAIEFLEKGYTLNSNYTDILGALASCYMSLGQYEESLKYNIKYIERLKALGPITGYGMAGVGYAYWKNGYKKEAEYYFNEQLNYCNRSIELRRPLEFYTHYDLAGVYAFRGDKDKAYKNLKIFNQKQLIPKWIVTLIKDDPLFAGLRNEPEFQQIVRDVEAKYQAEHERVRKWLEEQGML
jgi:TolB-like protein